MRSVELFGGAGGLALGVEQAGFSGSHFVEWNRWACDTVRENQRGGFSLVSGWNVIEGDVRSVPWSDLEGTVDLLAGGPPCQPFSMGGKAKAADDRRDMFPAAAEAILQIKPKAFLLENVRGLTRSAFSNYYQLILLRLRYPQLVANPGETWFEHLRRLQKVANGAGEPDLTYNVFPTVVDAADYGVPQRRQRVFIVGFRNDLKTNWSFPSPTHSKERLLYDQWVTGEYFERHRVSAREQSKLTQPSPNLLSRLSSEKVAEKSPWITVRDALNDLPSPHKPTAAKYLNHIFQPGAKIYPGHTGSPLDLPAKALKAGGHGVPGGENMMRFADGSVRYFTIRESARLQTFPDDYELHGAWSEAMRQLGNAVPVLLAKKVAASIAQGLKEAELEKQFVAGFDNFSLSRSTRQW